MVLYVYVQEVWYWLVYAQTSLATTWVRAGLCQGPDEHSACCHRALQWNTQSFVFHTGIACSWWREQAKSCSQLTEVNEEAFLEPAQTWWALSSLLSTQTQPHLSHWTHHSSLAAAFSPTFILQQSRIWSSDIFLSWMYRFFGYIIKTCVRDFSLFG